MTNLHQLIHWLISAHWCTLVHIGLLVHIGYLLIAPAPVFAQVSLDEIKGVPGPGYQNMPIGDAPSTLETIISNTVGFLTVAAGLSFAIYILLAGLTWITAREESERISKAKQMFTNALVGLAIVVSSWAFAGIMQTVFGFNILSPATIIENIIPKGGGGGPTTAPTLIPVPPGTH